MKKIIVLVVLIVLLVAGYLSFIDEKNILLGTDNSSPDIVSKKATD